MSDGLPAIPVIDARDGGPLRHARERARQARALRDECMAFFPVAIAKALPLIDRIARRWLRRSCSPYASEIGAIAETLGFPGVWFLNSSYEWGCTTLVRERDGAPWLARTLDWPFPGLGRHAEIAHMRGSAGEFFSVTWPGYAGVLTAMAPGRFAAALNQAPMWRRTRHPYLRSYDLVANALRTWKLRHIPSGQLLRLAFESCATFSEARRMLETTPVARPVIYTLAGCAPGEACVIEREEERFFTRWDDLSAANDWGDRRTGWEGRIAAQLFFRCSFDEAADNSRLRRKALASWGGDFAQDAFTWVEPPVLNPYTRLAVAMRPAEGMLRAAGYEPVPGVDLPQRATQIRIVDCVSNPA
jgi:hypothetical protein